MSEKGKRADGRPRVVPAGSKRLYVNLSPVIAEQLRALAAEERRTVTAQLELLLERGLRSYGLEVAAA